VVVSRGHVFSRSYSGSDGIFFNCNKKICALPASVRAFTKKLMYLTLSMKKMILPLFRTTVYQESQKKRFVSDPRANKEGATGFYCMPGRIMTVIETGFTLETDPSLAQEAYKAGTTVPSKSTRGKQTVNFCFPSKKIFDSICY
jgi:hypothetical protein